MIINTLTSMCIAFILAVSIAGTTNGQPPEPGSSTATVTAATPLRPETTPVNPQPATPLPESAKAMALVGYVIEDTDGNGLRSKGDKGAQTLVQMHRLAEGRIVSGATVLTDENGRFEFADASEGEYLLWVWWTPGFITLQGELDAAAVESHPDLLRLGIGFGSDGTAQFKHVTVQDEGGSILVRNAQDSGAKQIDSLTILVKPKPDGLIPYPVSVGEGEGPIPVGKVSLARLSMPSSGNSGGGTGPSLGWWLIGAGVVLLVAATAFLRLEKRRRRRRA